MGDYNRGVVSTSQKFVASHKMPGNANFNSIGNKLEIVDGDIGRCTTSLKIEQEHCNNYNTLHGGCAATLVDIVSWAALVTDSEDSLKHTGVSVNLNMNYMKPAKLGTDIIIDARVKKRGRTLAFLDVDIRDKENNSTLAAGLHTIFFK